MVNLSLIKKKKLRGLPSRTRKKTKTKGGGTYEDIINYIARNMNNKQYREVQLKIEELDNVNEKKKVWEEWTIKRFVGGVAMSPDQREARINALNKFNKKDFYSSKDGQFRVVGRASLKDKRVKVFSTVSKVVDDKEIQQDILDFSDVSEEIRGKKEEELRERKLIKRPLTKKQERVAKGLMATKEATYDRPGVMYNNYRKQLGLLTREINKLEKDEDAKYHGAKNDEIINQRLKKINTLRNDYKKYLSNFSRKGELVDEENMLNLIGIADEALISRNPKYKSKSPTIVRFADSIDNKKIVYGEKYDNYKRRMRNEVISAYNNYGDDQVDYTSDEVSNIKNYFSNLLQGLASVRSDEKGKIIEKHYKKGKIELMTNKWLASKEINKKKDLIVPRVAIFEVASKKGKLPDAETIGNIAIMPVDKLKNITDKKIKGIKFNKSVLKGFQKELIREIPVAREKKFAQESIVETIRELIPEEEKITKTKRKESKVLAELLSEF